MAEHKDGRGEHFYTRTKPRGAHALNEGRRDGLDDASLQETRDARRDESSLWLAHSLTYLRGARHVCDACCVLRSTARAWKRASPLGDPSTMTWEG